MQATHTPLFILINVCCLGIRMCWNELELECFGMSLNWNVLELVRIGMFWN